jgi:pSer/pThr/pTyr-binding forkhead associated (FHA) protein
MSEESTIKVNLNQVSQQHAMICYDKYKGWHITEKKINKKSTNGTFVELKNEEEVLEHQPSDLIPLQDGMVLSFLNYTTHVSFSEKSYQEYK